MILCRTDAGKLVADGDSSGTSVIITAASSSSQITIIMQGSHTRVSDTLQFQSLHLYEMGAVPPLYLDLGPGMCGRLPTTFLALPLNQPIYSSETASEINENTATNNRIRNSRCPAHPEKQHSNKMSSQL